MLTKNMFDC